MATHVEIIIGPEADFEAIRRSVNSVVAANTSTSFQVTLILSEAQMEAERDFIGQLETRSPIRSSLLSVDTKLYHTLNSILGSGQRDVVFLAGGAVVFDGWLDTFCKCIERFPLLATLSAFSTTEGVASYPRPWVGNSGDLFEQARRLAQIFLSVNNQKILELPAPQLSCTLLSKRAIQVVGAFGGMLPQNLQQLFEDWSQRATQQGFTHLLCGGVFAPAYVSPQSMQPTENPSPVDRPDLTRVLRRPVDWERLCRSDKPRVLLISHRQGGGVERHVSDLIAMLADIAEPLVLRPDGDGVIHLRWARAGEDWQCWFERGEEWAHLLSCLEALDVRRVHLHHVDGLPADLWNIAARLHVPLDITLHDHWPITSKYHLYLEEKTQLTPDELVWRNQARQLLNSADRVFAPSKYLSDAILAVYPEIHITYWPHPDVLEPKANASGPLLKVALLGRISDEKGLSVVRRCAEYVRRKGLPVHFRIIGPPSLPIPTYPGVPLDSTGAYNDADLPELISIERPDVLFFPSQVPESFSYTLTAAIKSGLPIVASNLGALIERLSDLPQATLLPYTVEPNIWCESLLEHLPSPNPARRARQSLDQANAIQHYLSVIPAPTGDGSAERADISFLAPPAANYFAPKREESPKEMSLPDLYRFGVDAGHAEAKRELFRRISQVDHEWAALRGELAAGQIQRQRLDAEVGELSRQLLSARTAEYAIRQELDSKLHQLEIRNLQYAQFEQSLEDARQQLLANQTALTEARRALGERSSQLDEFKVLTQSLYADIENQKRLADESNHRNTALSQQIQHLESELSEQAMRFSHAIQLTRDTLESERDAARAAFAEISGSKFWRMTGPIRKVAHWFKHLLVRSNNLANQSKGLPRRVSIATQILREEGAVALGRRVHATLSKKDSEPQRLTPTGYVQEQRFLPLDVPAAAVPRVSIVIPVYGQHLMTFTCLKSIAATCQDQKIEVIVIDDCSPEPAESALQMVTGIRHIRNAENLGFLKNCNKAVASAQGEFVVLLNNDVIVTPGWLDALTNTYDQRPDVGMVGAKLIYPDGRLQEAGGILWRDGSAWNWGRNQDASRPEYNYLREVDYCSGAVLLLKRSFWNELGGFDERYAPAYYEDTDLAFRVREAGKRVFYQPNAVVVHFEGQSSGTDLTQGVKRFQVVNQETFVGRWASILAKHRVNGQLPNLERDRYVAKRILVVDACMLTPDQDSGSLRMFEMLGVLASMNLKVTFFADNLEFREPYVSQIQSLGVEVIYHPVESYVTPLLERIAGDYDVIMLSRATVAVKHVDTVKRVAPGAKLVFDTVDLHFLRQEREAELANNALQRAAAATMKEQELTIMSKSDMTIVVSSVEQKLLADIVPTVRVGIVSNIHVTMPGPKGFADRHGAIFIGGFRHPPNIHAITWYVENVLPVLRRKGAGIVTTVIGSNAPPSLQKFASDDFVIAGFIPDVTPFYNDAKLSISPLRYGAGVKGKVNIAMQYGVPVVATSPSVEGMYLRSGKDVLCADDAEEFAAAMIRANSDAALWDTLRTNGLANIEQHFSRQTARRALGELLDIA
jgi:GT2 family glycosyltransferase/glycosyltransferase involved in cell wall biosynthesis